MITAVDTSVLLDVFLADKQHGPSSKQRLRSAYDRGALIICDVVYAELAPAFADRVALDNALKEVNVALSPLDASVAWEAGRRWMGYRRAGGPRTRILPDFLIAAHALTSADVFLTRDRGFYATYFPELQTPPP